ncbi:RNA polymerase sigma factor [Catelliglobosispora koreensis]|uniref:RNA polymerase sigma factor n=1 Tax=Catelliglobosispora koreensis TaxID=129052 RepID=UPI000A2F5E77|nr:RNA polymerase sigma factor [Catelliglobosispora koreensis]
MSRSGRDLATAEIARAVDAAWRAESARVIATLARMVHDIGLAEELAQDALVSALEQWPSTGVPDNPGAWLTAVAKRRAIDQFRRQETLQRKVSELGRDTDFAESFEEHAVADLDDDIRDDVLKLIFTACHPVLSQEARVALTLKMIGGLTTEEIARAYLSTEPTIAQRIVRAKKTLAQKQIPFEIPSGDELGPRFASVLEVVYAIFNEGYSATSGDSWTRPTLCGEALRLGHVLSGLAPGEAEVHGLVALMEIQASRLRARTDPSGKPIVLLNQDRTLWDVRAIRRGLSSLERAESLGSGPYTLQAAIAACHARAGAPEQTDWARIAALYEQLPSSPVVELNRAVAVSMAQGPQAALDILDPLLNEPSLKDYHLLPAVRGDLLARLGRNDLAKVELARAAEMTRNATEREFLLQRIATL